MTTTTNKCWSKLWWGVEVKYEGSLVRTPETHDLSIQKYTHDRKNTPVPVLKESAQVRWLTNWGKNESALDPQCKTQLGRRNGNSYHEPRLVDIETTQHVVRTQLWAF